MNTKPVVKQRSLVLLLVVIGVGFAAAMLNFTFSLADVPLAGPVAPVSIGITGDGFLPDPASAAVDQPVAWTNLTTATITLTSYPPCTDYFPLLAKEAVTANPVSVSGLTGLGDGSWTSGPIAPGGTFSRTFAVTGMMTVYQDCGRGITGTLQITTTLPTPTSTPIPVTPYINVAPGCWTPGNPNTQIALNGGNWPVNPPAYAAIHIEVRDRWNHATAITTIPQGHGGAFNMLVNVGTFLQANAPYTFMAQADNGAYAITSFTMPCPSQTPTPTPTVPSIDLIIVSQPTVIFTPPIVAGEPLTITYLITNVGTANVTDLFYVDTFFNPLNVTSTTIPISYSVYYVAIGSLAAGQTRTLTMTIPHNSFFDGITPLQAVMGMVDSILQIGETNETNNITLPLYVPVVTPTPGPGCLSGITRYFDGQSWVPASLAELYLVENGTVVATTVSGPTGYFAFASGCTSGTNFTVASCYETTTEVYYGSRSGLTPPNSYVDVFMIPGVSCPFP